MQLIHGCDAMSLSGGCKDIEGGPVYIEQWTWDGEPVKRYVLEKEMYPYSGCIDEKNSAMYLFDVLQDDFVYKVQMEGEIL